MPGKAYFITKCALVPEDPILTKPGCADVVVDALLWARNSGWWRVLGFVVMPDHYHAALALGNTKSLSDAMWSIGKYTAARINRLLGRTGGLWEEGFYDHLIRDRDDFDEVLKYVHENPVAAGLVESVELWPYSTANCRYASDIDWEWLGSSVP